MDSVKQGKLQDSNCHGVFAYSPEVVENVPSRDDTDINHDDMNNQNVVTDYQTYGVTNFNYQDKNIHSIAKINMGKSASKKGKEYNMENRKNDNCSSIKNDLCKNNGLGPYKSYKKSHKQKISSFNSVVDDNYNKVNKMSLEATTTSTYTCPICFDDNVLFVSIGMISYPLC